MTHRDPHREFLDQMLRAMAKQIDRDMLKGTSQDLPTMFIGDHKVEGRISDFKVRWTEEDEPMTELAESFVRGSPKAECDCPACTNTIENERRMWAEIGIDVFGKENT